MNKLVLVTGGASFIGSHLVERLLEQGNEVRVIDNFSSGSKENLSSVWNDVEIMNYDMLHRPFVEAALDGVEIVYHLAADHGGRGYVDLHQLDCSNNFAIDQILFQAIRREKVVEKVIFASSGCIYPMHLQNNPDEEVYLAEEDAGPPYDPDGLYGMAKLVAELTLKKMWEEDHIKGVSCRFFTVYGPRAKENHAVIAMIARAAIKQNPFEIWGNGKQVRNWTYVDDIVDGLVASESLADKNGYDVVNLGTTERITVKQAVLLITAKANYPGELAFSYRLDMPTGPMNRVADNRKMIMELGIEPMAFAEGVKLTQEWYNQTKDLDWVKENLERVLIERK